MNAAILVTGDRHADAREWWTAVASVLDHTHDRLIVIHGACAGIDDIADRAAEYANRAATIPMPYIDALGYGGGPARNRQMVAVLTALRNVGYQTSCYAFHDAIETSKGTKGCARLAFDAGHETWVCKSDGTRTRYLKNAAGITEESR